VTPDLERFAKLAEHAAALIPDGGVIGLGSGRTATAFVHALGRRVKQGLRVRGVPTSLLIADLARNLGIPLTTLEEAGELDVDVDGADEVDPNLDLIKGLGGALVREKIVAASARKLIIVVTPEKQVPVLGQRGVLPVEVVPFGLHLVERRLIGLGLNPRPRQENAGLFLTDNGNYILDCGIQPIASPCELEQAISAIPGVVDTGLFLGMADSVLIQDGEELKILNRRG
jgi:ribose 5-phosphate isomerase A